MSESPLQLNATPQSWWQRLTLSQIALGTIVVALIIFAAFTLVTLRYVIILMFLGIVLATALGPVFERMRGFGTSRAVAATTALLLLFALIGAALAATIPFFLTQIAAVIGDLPARYSTLRDSLAGSPTQIIRDLALILPRDPFTTVAPVGGENNQIETALSSVLFGTVRGVAFGGLVLLLSYYWLYYRALAIQSLALLVPIDWRNQAVDIWNKIEIKIGAFVRGLAVLGVSIGLLSLLGYSLIGLPYALTLGIIAGILEAVPYVGPLVTMVIAVVVGLTVSPEKALLAFVVANIIQLLENTIVVPRAMDKTVGVNPVVTLLALAVFGELFGLIGALLAVPLAAALQVLLDQFVLNAPTADQLDIGGRGQIALLRYKTQDLASDIRQQVRSKEDETTTESDVEEEELEALLSDLDSLLATAQEQTS